ncbi:MAG: lipoyl(octanoyl) transferase LipB [Bauldia sp.]|nr:lipoyl(octanoyl) transferase LipB [Bauldia sp.]
MLNTRPVPLLPRLASATVEWRVSAGPTGYEDAVAGMEEAVGAVLAGGPERVWLVEHPPLYTAGTSARPEDLLDPGRFPVHASGRGGQYTYHGPGQRVAYAMLDLQRRGPDLRAFVASLEEWLIRTVAAFGVSAERREGRVGLWVRRPERGDGAEDKIAAIGIRVRRWVSFHGVALNVSPDLSHYDGIVPCGVRDQGVTSLADLGVKASMDEVDLVLRREFEALFGPTA